MSYRKGDYEHLRGRAHSKRGGNERPDDGLDRSEPQGLAHYHDLYLAHLEVRNFSASTLSRSRGVLAAFLRWCQERDLKRPGEITRPMIESYQRSLFLYRKRDGKPLSFAVQQAHLSVIRQYFRWLSKQRVILANPASDIEPPRMEKRLPQPALNLTEIETLLLQPNLSDPLGIRDRAILETFYSNGIRRFELCGLDLGDLDRERRTLFIRLGKGKKDRLIPIGERALLWIETYLTKARPAILVDPGTQALFLSAYGEALNPDYLTRLVTGYLKKAGLGKSGSCHLLRHSCATHMHDNGADIRYIQQLLGHDRLSSTEIYTHVSIVQLQRVHEMTHPARLEKRVE